MQRRGGGTARDYPLEIIPFSPVTNDLHVAATIPLKCIFLNPFLPSLLSLQLFPPHTFFTTSLIFFASYTNILFPACDPWGKIKYIHIITERSSTEKPALWKTRKLDGKRCAEIEAVLVFLVPNRHSARSAFSLHTDWAVQSSQLREWWMAGCLHRCFVLHKVEPTLPQCDFCVVVVCNCL